MKKLILTVSTIVLAGAAINFSHAQGKGKPSPAEPKLETEADSVAYALGTDFGVNLKRLDSTINVDMLAIAAKDMLGNKPQMTQEDATAFLNEYFMVRIPAKNKAEATAWLDEVKAQNPNVQVTESGLMYEIIDEGDPTIKATSDDDEVQVNYKGTLKDGTEFDQNDSITFALKHVIAGWTEGMKLVGKGGEIIMWIPSELGYGERGMGTTIPGNAALRFDVTLLDVIPALVILEEPAEIPEYYEDFEADDSDEDLYVYDDDGNTTQYPSDDVGYVWRMVKKAKPMPETKYRDSEGNTWKKIETPIVKKKKK